MPIDGILDRLDALVEQGDLDGVERDALGALKRASGDDAEELWRYVAWARFEGGRLDAALDAARKGRDRLWEGKVLFHLWEFDAAARALDGYRGERDDAAEAEWYRGLLDEFAGRDPGRHFRKAALLAPDLYPEPVRLSDAEVDRVVQAALRALPPDVRKIAEEAVIEVRPLPSRHPDIDPLSLGLHLGHGRLQRSVDDAVRMPSRIEIYRANIERYAADRDAAIDELRITLLHEIAHELGYGEDGVDALGLA